MTVHYLRRAPVAVRQPDEPTPADRFRYLDSIAVQIGVGTIALCWFGRFFAYASIAYGVDTLIRGGQAAVRQARSISHTEGRRVG